MLKFLNKVTLKPIRAQDVQTGHQADSMEMGKSGTASYNGKSYRYVLSAIDVFSRFTWLHGVSKKVAR